MSAADIDGWHAGELIALCFLGDDEELQGLIRIHMILPYLFGDFHPSHIQEYACGLLLALEKFAKDGGGVFSPVAFQYNSVDLKTCMLTHPLPRPTS